MVDSKGKVPGWWTFNDAKDALPVEKADRGKEMRAMCRYTLPEAGALSIDSLVEHEHEHLYYRIYAEQGSLRA